MPNDRIPAAQYLRVSSPKQKEALATQAGVISEFALRNGFAVIATFSDVGSGVGLRSRSGMKALLKEVTLGAAFKAILVFDVSRWGRFQDTDESAHYEFICKQAGIPVFYCGEGGLKGKGLGSILMKSLKRSFAAEYSRELGEKVLRAEKRLASLGYVLGGAPPLGLRRMLIRADGKEQTILGPGERKSNPTDRIRYVMGPQEEVETVQTIFSLYREGMGTRQIAEILEGLHSPHPRRRKWAPPLIRSILHNPKYAGIAVWRRSTGRLQTAVRRTPAREWVLAPGQIPAMISERHFRDVQKQFRDIHLSDEELLGALRGLLRKEGLVTSEALKAEAGLPSYSAIRERFGTLVNALKLIGENSPRAEHIRHYMEARNLHRKVLVEIQKAAEGRVSICKLPTSVKRGLMVDSHFEVDVIVATRRRVKSGKTVWFIRPTLSEREQICLCCLASSSFDSVEGFYLVGSFPESQRAFLIEAGVGWFREAVSMMDLKEFSSLALALHAQKATLTSGSGNMDIPED